jgi:hypothetical protein
MHNILYPLQRLIETSRCGDIGHDNKGYFILVFGEDQAFSLIFAPNHKTYIETGLLRYGGRPGSR